MENRAETFRDKVFYQRELPVSDSEYDVVCVGGGSAGICASIAAARHGARTLLIERTGWLGGIGTTAAMVEFGPIVRGGLRVLGGIPWEIMRRMREFGAAETRFETEHLFFAPESFAHVSMNMCLEAGVELLLHTHFADVIRRGDHIEGIVLDAKEGLRVIRSRVYIDASGDGEVFFKAGLPFFCGREEDRGTQPMTLVFFVNNVNYARFLDHVDAEANGDPVPYFEKLVEKAREEGRFHIPITRPGSTGPVPRLGRPYDLSCCEVFINGTNVLGKSGTDSRELTEAECAARNQIPEMYEFFRRYVPGFEECYVSHVPSEIGVRETRRLKGVHTLTAEDLKTGRKFEDTVAVGFNMIDVHQVAGHDFDLTHFRDGHYYSVPYRCLISGETDNLIVAGRCISATHEALGAVRVMVNTMPIAQGAGTAAMIAARDKTDVGKIPVGELRSTLLSDGAVLEL